MTIEDFYAKAERNIRETGRAVLYVAAAPVFAYTIGNSLRNLPELIVFGISPGDSTMLLNAWSNLMIKRGASFGDGEMVRFDEFSDALPCRAMRCDGLAKLRYSIQIGQVLGIDDRAYDLMQMLVPDKFGVFPDDPRCDPPYAMPVLSARRPS